MCERISFGTVVSAAAITINNCALAGYEFCNCFRSRSDLVDLEEEASRYKSGLRFRGEVRTIPVM